MTNAHAPAMTLSLIDRTRADELALFLAHWRGSLIAVSIVTLAIIFAGYEYVSLDARWLWCAAIFGNYGGQALLCRKLELEPSLSQAFPRYMPWLLASVTISSTLWAIVPWLISDPSSLAMAMASLFNIFLIYSLANAPSAHPMLICAISPILLLDTLALATRISLTYAAAFAVSSGVILIYGLRIQAAINSAMMERHVSKDLAEELKNHQQQIVKIERENAMLQERQRLMQDMHDGLGSALLSTLYAIEHNQMSQESVIEALRACVDDLRMVIDSLEPMEHDLVILLATIRYRFGERLAAAGLNLEWNIHDLPELPWLEPPDVLNVLRLVQEALVNTLKHSSADRVRVSTLAFDNLVEIKIEDNGHGFDTNTVRMGRGLRSQASRAERLGGNLRIESVPGKGTLLSLLLPVEREKPSTSQL
ncbi:MAG: sensor histidine kinase [Gammaproteobacteria bacterium]